MVGPFLKAVGKQIVKMAAKKGVQEAAKDIAIAGASFVVGETTKKIFSDKSMSFEKKLKMLDKLKESEKITEEEYKKLREKLIDSQ
jgi:uncharacterized protein (DUF697 family)